MRNKILVGLLLLFCSALCLAQEKQIAELKAQYMTLRNTDIALARSGEWESLARQFEQFVDKNPRYADNPSALLNAAILLQTLYGQFGGEDRLKKVTTLLERIARDYPGHFLVDDALMRKGDLLLFDVGEVAGARRAYEELVRAYPDSELLIVAESRLASIKDGSYLTSAQVAQNDSVSEQRSDDKRIPLIVLDPGHGGEDFGAPGVEGLLEKDVALALAFELERMLKQKLKAAVRLTRRSDVFVPLAARTQLANDFDADLFISLHANSSPGGKASGFEIYYLDNSDSSASRALADRENASKRFEDDTVDDLQFMLSDLIQNAKLDESIMLANILHRNMQGGLKPVWPTARGLGVKKAHFYVLVGAHMPCVLVESFFINNKVDGSLLARKDFRTAIASSLYRGIAEYLRHQKRIS